MHINWFPGKKNVCIYSYDDLGSKLWGIYFQKGKLTTDILEENYPILILYLDLQHLFLNIYIYNIRIYIQPYIYNLIYTTLYDHWSSLIISNMFPPSLWSFTKLFLAPLLFLYSKTSVFETPNAKPFLQKTPWSPQWSTELQSSTAPMPSTAPAGWWQRRFHHSSFAVPIPSSPGGVFGAWKLLTATFPETNISSPLLGRKPQKGKDHLPTIHSGAKMLVLGRVTWGVRHWA